LIASLLIGDPRRVLKHEVVNIDEIQHSLDEQLAGESQEHLGYNATPMLKRAALMRAMQKLRLKPYTDVSVEKYKRLVIFRNRPLLFRNPLASLLWSPIENRLWPLVFSGVACVLCFMYGLVGGGFFRAPYALQAFGMAGSLMAWMVIGWLYSGSGGRWESVSIEEFSNESGEMSKQAAHVGVMLAKELPGAQFTVCRHVGGHMLDPFLVVTHGPVTKYIAVWDEREFR